MIDAQKAGPLFVLNWGPMNETASAIEYLLTAGDSATLDQMTVITHWTTPSSDYNCNVDAAACAYVHQQASAGKVKLYELGPMGQRELVDDGSQHGCQPQPKHNVRECDRQAHEREVERERLAGYVRRAQPTSCSPDLEAESRALKPDGTFDAAGPNRLCNDRGKIASPLEAAATAAAQ